MAIEVLMPKLGLTMTEGTIEEWMKQEGDPVKKGDVLFSVATDKLVNEVEAETDGVLVKILLVAGETAECKSVVAYLGEAGESVAAPAAAAPAAAPVEPAAPAPVAAAPTQAPAVGDRIRISPYARRTARELGVDIAAVAGTGPNGRIIWRDVDAAYQTMQAAAAAAPAAPAAPAAVSALAGLYTAADVTELLAAVDSLKGALTAAAFVERAAAKLAAFPVEIRDLGTGILGGMPCLRTGEMAVVAMGQPEDGRMQLHLVYDTAAVEDLAAADFLRALRAAVENPLSLLV